MKSLVKGDLVQVQVLDVDERYEFVRYERKPKSSNRQTAILKLVQSGPMNGYEISVLVSDIRKAL